jgi:hypothetical protein
MMTSFTNADGSGLIGGLNQAGVGQALRLDINGSLLVQPWNQAMNANGSAFMASNGLLNAVAGNYPLAVFNPAASGKNVLIYSIRISTGTGSSNGFLQVVTTNPAYGSAAVVTNKRLGSVASAIATDCTFTGTSQTLNAPYAKVELLTTYPAELLSNGCAILLPSGSATGLVAWITTFSGGYSSITVEWIEY